jgi:hypothetical protein
MDLEKYMAALIICLPFSLGCGSEGGSSGSNSSASSSSGNSSSGSPQPNVTDAYTMAAIFLGSCVPNDSIGDFLNDAYWINGPDVKKIRVSDFVECLKDKQTGCTAVDECLGLKADFSGPCTASCTNNVLEACDNQLRFVWDCSRVGLQCDAAKRFCTDGAPNPICDSTMFVSTCKDGAPSHCSAKEETLGPICAAHGTICKEAPVSGALCTGPDAACTVPSFMATSISYTTGIACEGSKLRACINGAEQVVDCSTVRSDFSCQTFGTTSFCGIGNTCNPNLGEKTACEGSNVVICNAGRAEKVDCTALGFTNCNESWGTCGPGKYDAAMP